jgi:two-component system, NarL family, sensor histidine kinase UhpB
VGLILSRDPDGVTVVVEDDGLGFDPEQAGKDNRLGLVGMRERAIMLGGDMTVESAPGKGTTIFVNLPYREAVPLVDAVVD